MQGEGTTGRTPRRRQVGVVTSNRGDKTIRVVCRFIVKHAKYGKYLRRRTVLHAHDERNECGVGDRVEVMECRPVSKTKHWRLVRIVNRAPATAAVVGSGGEP
ncbi:MAG: 30S ribosomal protein S17 [Phycisphaerales bacterium]|nr:30S ribosomal protein S17 [Phycisphaerales bacterium]